MEGHEPGDTPKDAPTAINYRAALFAKAHRGQKDQRIGSIGEHGEDQAQPIADGIETGQIGVRADGVGPEMHQRAGLIKLGVKQHGLHEIELQQTGQ